jgi:aquaporin Z
MAWSSGHRYLAEFLGTFGLLLSIGGAAVFSLEMGGNLASLDSFVLLASLSLGFGVLGMIYAFGDISGAHFNPAVTVGMWVSGRLPARDVVPYVVCQILGGIVAMGIIVGIASSGPVSLSSMATANGFASQGYANSGIGSPYLYSLGSVFLLEVTFTFFLVLVILFATRGEASAKNLAPIGIALTLIMTNLVAIPVDGASVNPARSLAPAVFAAFYSGGHWAIDEVWLFFVAPIIGGILAAVVDRIYRH